MTHTHELLRLRERRGEGGQAAQQQQEQQSDTDSAPAALDPRTRPSVPTMHTCMEAVREPAGDSARAIVAFVAWLGMSAIHPGKRAAWSESHGGEASSSSVQTAGNEALKRRFTDLATAQERMDDEIVLANRVLCHACGSYCLKPVVSKRTGQPILDAQGEPKKACRFRVEEKAEHSCACPHCSADIMSQLQCEEGACVACEAPSADGAVPCGCGVDDCGCKTVVWQLPRSYRFELRYGRNLSTLQVSMRPLTQGVRRNYDVQFVLDYPAVIDYLLKYIGKPEASSHFYKNVMSGVFQTSEVTQSLSHICAAAMNEVLGRRDFTDTEVRAAGSRLTAQLHIS